MSTRSYNRPAESRARRVVRSIPGPRLVRRFTAGLLALAFMASSAETLIADVHDGDATAQEVETIASSGNASSGVLLRGDAPSEDSEKSSGHSMHVCHCIHAHGGLPGHLDVRSESSEARLQVRGVSDRMPASASLEPAIRPPAA